MPIFVVHLEVLTFCAILSPALDSLVPLTSGGIARGPLSSLITGAAAVFTIEGRGRGAKATVSDAGGTSRNRIVDHLHTLWRRDIRITHEINPAQPFTLGWGAEVTDEFDADGRSVRKDGRGCFLFVWVHRTSQCVELIWFRGCNRVGRGRFWGAECYVIVAGPGRLISWLPAEIG